MSKVNTPETITQIKKQLCQLPPPQSSLHLAQPTTTRFFPF